MHQCAVFTATPTLQLLQFRVQDFSDGLKIRPPWFHAVFLSARILVNKWQLIFLWIDIHSLLKALRSICRPWNNVSRSFELLLLKPHLECCAVERPRMYSPPQQATYMPISNIRLCTVQCLCVNVLNPFLWTSLPTNSLKKQLVWREKKYYKKSTY